MINKQKPIPPAVSKFCRLCYMAIMQFQNFVVCATWLSYPTTSEYWYPSYMDLAPHNFDIF